MASTKTTLTWLSLSRERQRRAWFQCPQIYLFTTFFAAVPAGFTTPPGCLTLTCRVCVRVCVRISCASIGKVPKLLLHHRDRGRWRARCRQQDNRHCQRHYNPAPGCHWLLGQRKIIVRYPGTIVVTEVSLRHALQSTVCPLLRSVSKADVNLECVEAGPSIQAPGSARDVAPALGAPLIAISNPNR